MYVEVAIGILLTFCSARRTRIGLGRRRLAARSGNKATVLMSPNLDQSFAVEST